MPPIWKTVNLDLSPEGQPPGRTHSSWKEGSGRVKLTDGSIIRIHYDGKNGHPYSSIGRYLIEKGLLAADKVSMGALNSGSRPTPSAASW